MDISTALDHAELVLALLGIAVVLYGFYTGWFQRYIRRFAGFHELNEQLESIDKHTEDLKLDHRETLAELQTLKHGQIAIAEAVDNEHGTVAVERLREAHFGDRSHADDFLRTGD